MSPVRGVFISIRSPVTERIMIHARSLILPYLVANGRKRITRMIRWIYERRFILSWQWQMAILTSNQ
jgi:hypothetical protein